MFSFFRFRSTLSSSAPFNGKIATLTDAVFVKAEDAATECKKRENHNVTNTVLARSDYQKRIIEWILRFMDTIDTLHFGIGVNDLHEAILIKMPKMIYFGEADETQLYQLSLASAS